MRRTLSLTLGILLACATIATASNNKKERKYERRVRFYRTQTPSEHFGKITGQSRNLLVMVNRFFPRIRNHASR